MENKNRRTEHSRQKEYSRQNQEHKKEHKRNIKGHEGIWRLGGFFHFSPDWSSMQENKGKLRGIKQNKGKLRKSEGT